MIVAGHMLECDAHGEASLRLGWLRVHGERIVECGTGSPPAAVDLGGEDWFVSPGFVDPHLHLPQFDCIGADGMTLLDWLERVVFPAEARWEDPAYAGSMTERVVRELLSHGTTGFAGYGTVHVASAHEALRVVGGAGIRALVGPSLMDRGAPDSLVRPACELLRDTAGLEQVGRAEPAVTPRFAISCTAELLKGAGDVARAKGWAVQTHLSEMRAEVDRVGELFPGMSYTEVYDRAGLLGPRTVLGHGIWLNADERTLLRDRGCVIAHCPASNVFLRSGLMPWSRWKAEGLRLGVATDVAAGNDRSMVRAARAMVETSKLVADRDEGGAGVVTPAQAWWSITRGNADALGWADCGRLEVGASADFVLAQPNRAWLGTADPLGALLYGWDDRWVRRVFVMGRDAYAA